MKTRNVSEKFYIHLLHILTNQLEDIQIQIEQAFQFEGSARRSRLKSHHVDRKLREKYELLTLLAHYCDINREGFRKIVKKWDKNTADSELDDFMNQIDRLSFSDHTELKDKIIQCERMYADTFMNNDIEAAKESYSILKFKFDL
eukprot:TRINITY_DN7075_c0_g1_i1.p1 TRINITY_DN7075_c0_g1~~TRINITY_DN7075_c0_g1_i1.p1  ORF type:complete len:145 (-),score=19.95 TRINITY_DN7075_c0_g1_i1:135-569(-)